MVRKLFGFTRKKVNCDTSHSNKHGKYNIYSCENTWYSCNKYCGLQHFPMVKDTVYHNWYLMEINN